MITKEVLEEFKKRMRIDYDIDDDNLTSLLERSYSVIKMNCGEFDFDNKNGKFLVFEHARYSFNDDVEFFLSNFANDMASFAFSLRKQEVINND